MQFNIDHDGGDCVAGWIVPNNPNATPSVKIVINGEEVAVIVANVNRSDIKDLGLHSTGLIGFHLDEDNLPGIATAVDLQIIDQETGVLVHRRSPVPFLIEERVMFFNLCVVPQIRMRNDAANLFALSYANSERINYETLYSILRNHHAQSVFVMGRTNHNRISEALSSSGFKRMALLREPLVELAERLILIKQISRSTKRSMLESLVFGVENLFSFVETVDLEAEASLQDAFRQMRPQQVRAIADPFLSAIVCDAGDEPEERHISLALDRLAEFDVVGVEERMDAFNICVEEAIGRNMFAAYDAYQLPGTLELVDRLRNIDKVAEYLEYDTALYREVRGVIDREFAV
ncbi:hypothetical protein [Stappia sp.]|uniref:hypothetical protein n=1 Tax=Stappia sp. TaxID=1870903 RepID=UPI003A991D8D